MTDKVVYPEEIEVLCAMDDEFVKAMNVEIRESNEREKAKAKQKAENK